MGKAGQDVISYPLFGIKRNIFLFLIRFTPNIKVKNPTLANSSSSSAE